MYPGFLSIKEILFFANLALFALFFIPFEANASNGRTVEYTYTFPGKTMIGEAQSYTLVGGEALSDIARIFDLGYKEVADANLGIDPGKAAAGREIKLPTAWLLPEIIEAGIVINLPEMRLYYFYMSDKEKKVVRTFPIGIGRAGYSTPAGDYSVTAKLKSPIWFPPETSRKAIPTLPLSVPPGPDNPLGDYWLQLSIKGYGVHGTNSPSTIGKKISLGCIRLYPEDIKWLFSSVENGARVKIIDMPVKIGSKDNRTYIEVHSGNRNPLERYEAAISKIRLLNLENINFEAVEKAAYKATGLPVLISK